MFWTDLLVAALAATQLVWLWLDGSIFARPRQAVYEFRDRQQGTICGVLCELLTCQFCLLPWVSLLLVITLSLTVADSPWRWPIYAMAVTRLGHTLNELTNRLKGPESMLVDGAGDTEELLPAASPAPPLETDDEPNLRSESRDAGGGGDDRPAEGSA